MVHSTLAICPRSQSSQATLSKMRANFSWMAVNDNVNLACSHNGGRAPRFSGMQKGFPLGWTLEVRIASLPAALAISSSEGSSAASGMFFFSCVADNALGSVPYNCVSSENLRIKGHVWPVRMANQCKPKTRHTKTKPKRPANPPARFAFRLEKHSETTKNGARPNRNTQQRFAM